MKKSFSFGFDIARELSAIIYKETGKRPYWQKTIDIFESELNSIYASEYLTNKTPEKQHFPKFRDYFSMLYHLYEDIFNEDPIKENGKIEVSWIEIEDNDKDKFYFSNINRGLKLSIYEKQIDSNEVDIDFPISELFEAARTLEMSGYKCQRKYTLGIIYTVYCLIANSINKIPSPMTDFCEDVKKMVSKTEGGLKGKIENNSDFFKPMFKRNETIIKKFTDQIKIGIEDIQENDIEDIAEMANDKMILINNQDSLSLTSIFSDFLPSDVNLEEKLKNGEHKDLYDKMLKDNDTSSIPTIDEIINGKK